MFEGVEQSPSLVEGMMDGFAEQLGLEVGAGTALAGAG